MAMPHLVIMGVAGCGKSVLSSQLAQALSWRAVEGDDHHLESSQTKMRQGIPLDDADREPWLRALGHLLATSPEPVVLSCSSLKRSYRQMLRAQVPDLRFVYLRMDMQTTLERVGARTGHLFPRSLVASQFATLEPPEGEAGVLTLPGTLPTLEQIQAVQHWLASSPTPVST